MRVGTVRLTTGGYGNPAPSTPAICDQARAFQACWGLASDGAIPILGDRPFRRCRAAARWPCATRRSPYDEANFHYRSGAANWRLSFARSEEAGGRDEFRLRHRTGQRTGDIRRQPGYRERHRGSAGGQACERWDLLGDRTQDARQDYRRAEYVQQRPVRFEFGGEDRQVAGRGRDHRGQHHAIRPRR